MKRQDAGLENEDLALENVGGLKIDQGTGKSVAVGKDRFLLRREVLTKGVGIKGEVQHRKRLLMV